jgi:hypothetical protein
VPVEEREPVQELLLDASEVSEVRVHRASPRETICAE